MRRYFVGLSWAALLLGCVGVTYQVAEACDHNCRPILWSCKTTAGGNCMLGQCYEYTPHGTASCWTCGGSGGGWCVGGDANLKCVTTNAMISYNWFQSCSAVCNNANAFVLAGPPSDPLNKVGTEQREYCAVK